MVLFVVSLQRRLGGQCLQQGAIYPEELVAQKRLVIRAATSSSRNDAIATVAPLEVVYVKA
jgi:hypothetical protein